MSGDAGEGLIDADARIQERMEELERDRMKATLRDVRDPEAVRAYESLRLAKAEMERQFAATSQKARRTQLKQAIQELTSRMKALESAVK